jgi:hypothetical protein
MLGYVIREMTYVGAGAKDQQLQPRPQLPSKAAGLAGSFDASDDHEDLVTHPRDLHLRQRQAIGEAGSPR